MNEEILNSGTTTGLSVNESMKATLLSAAKWAKFLCIVSSIAVGFIVLFGVLFMFIGPALASIIGEAPIPLGGAMGFMYLIIAAIYIYPIVKGFQFANGIKAACLSNDEFQLARGFSGLHSLLQFCGILTIICIILYGFFILIALILGSAVALHG